jgi:hypothetical protein
MSSQEYIVTARQRLGKHMSQVTQAIIELRSLGIRYTQCNLSRVKAVSNTSTVTLRVLGGDEKEVSNLRQ